LSVDNTVVNGLSVDNLIGDGFAGRQFDWRWVCRSTIWLAMGLPVDNLIGDGLSVDNLCFKVAFFEYESLYRSNHQTKSYNGNKADKSNEYSTRSFTVNLSHNCSILALPNICRPRQPPLSPRPYYGSGFWLTGNKLIKEVYKLFIDTNN